MEEDMLNMLMILNLLMLCKDIENYMTLHTHSYKCLPSKWKHVGLGLNNT